MKIFDTCPGCNAPVYDDPLAKLFVRDGVPTRVYECGSHLAFHDTPPVRVKVIAPCPYAFRKAIERATPAPAAPAEESETTK